MKDQAVIAGDVDRSFICINGCDEEEKINLRKELANLLNVLVVRNEGLRYYQGLHDIAGGFLLVLDPETALLATEIVCKYYIQYLLYFVPNNGILCNVNFSLIRILTSF